MANNEIAINYSQLLIERFLETHPTATSNSQFAIDLYTALQNHQPLTVFQKAFLLASSGLPSTYDSTLSFFSFLYSHHSITLPLLVILGLIFVLIVLNLIYKFAWRWLLKRESFVFMELVFPAGNNKSAYATEQFFTLLHSLAKPKDFLYKILGFKKQYSLEITASKDQGIRYILVAPLSDTETLKKGLLSYLPGLKINEVSDYLPTGKQDRNKLTGLKLAYDFALPLKDNKVLDEHDPIAYLTGNMTKLKPNELMVFQIVASPVISSSHRDEIGHIKKINKLVFEGQSLKGELNQNPILKFLAWPYAVLKVILLVFSFCLKYLISMVVAFWDTKGKSVPFLAKEPEKQKLILSLHELELQNAIKGKIEKPLFETSIRLYVETDNLKEGRQRVNGFMASIGQLTSPYQALMAKPLIKISPFFSFSVKPFAKRELSLFNNPILSSSELTDLYHFPYAGTTKTEDMVRGKSQPLPAPLSFKMSENKFDNVFAKNNFGGTETIIGQTLDERRRHTYILGATGSGKTTLLSDMIYQDIISGKGVAVLDPHGQLVEKILTVIPKERIKDVVWFAPDDDGFPIALNLLELPKPKDGSFTASQLQKQKSLVASSIISIIQKFYDAKFFGPRMEYVLRNTILTALETESPTLLTILDILTKTPYRKKVVSELQNQVLKDYWVYEFEKLGGMQKSSVISPITNKIGGILSSPINYNILCQKESKLDFEDVINSGKILLCDLSKGKIGEDESSFFGSLIVAKIQLAALRRALISEDDRKDFYLYIDEFQNFATNTFAELVSEARKYRLSTILAHQSISQIENRDIIKVILANVGTVICFKTANPEDEQFILPIFSPEVLKHEISNLPLYNFYMKVSVGQAEDTFIAQTDNFTVEGDENIENMVIEESRKHFANPVVILPIKDEKTDKQMIQKAIDTKYHLVKTNDTEKGQIHAQNAENFSTYPIQEGSKDGIGIIVNINEKNVSSKTQKETIPTTPQQQQILSLLYRFRFLDRTQIQQFLNHKYHKQILVWLNDLIDNKSVETTKLPKSKAKIYYLTKNSIPLLLEEDGDNKQLLQKLYSENERSNSFIESCLLLADIYLDLQKNANDSKKTVMYVKSDYHNMPLVEVLNDLSPHAFIEQNSTDETKCCFLEILANLPEERLRQRIKKYLRFYQENTWEAETSKPFPTVLIICPSDEKFNYVKSYTKSKLRSLDEPSLTVRLSTVKKIREFGIGGDVWVTL